MAELADRGPSKRTNSPKDRVKEYEQQQSKQAITRGHEQAKGTVEECTAAYDKE